VCKVIFKIILLMLVVVCCYRYSVSIFLKCILLWILPQGPTIIELLFGLSVLYITLKKSIIPHRQW